MFWDTKGTELGSYNAAVTVHYAGKTAERDATVTVGQALGPGIEIYAIVAVVIIALLVFILFRKKKTKH